MTSLFGLFGGFIGSALQVLALVVFVVGVIYVVLRSMGLSRVGGSLVHWGRSQVDKVGEYAANQDPVAQMRTAARDAEAELKEADEGLKTGETLKLQLNDQIDDQTKRLVKIKGIVANKLQKGTPPTDQTVTAKLQEITTLEDSIAANTAQVQTVDKQLAAHYKKAEKAAAKIQAAYAEADSLGFNIKMAQQNAALEAMFSKYTGGAVNSKLAELDKHRENAQKLLRQHQASAIVAQKRGPAMPDDDEDEENVDATTDPKLADVLARLKEEKGI